MRYYIKFSIKVLLVTYFMTVSRSTEQSLGDVPPDMKLRLELCLKPIDTSSK